MLKPYPYRGTLFCVIHKHLRRKDRSTIRPSGFTAEYFLAVVCKLTLPTTMKTDSIAVCRDDIIMVVYCLRAIASVAKCLTGPSHFALHARRTHGGPQPSRGREKYALAARVPQVVLKLYKFVTSEVVRVSRKLRIRFRWFCTESSDLRCLAFLSRATTVCLSLSLFVGCHHVPFAMAKR